MFSAGSSVAPGVSGNAIYVLRSVGMVFFPTRSHDVFCPAAVRAFCCVAIFFTKALLGDPSEMRSCGVLVRPQPPMDYRLHSCEKRTWEGRADRGVNKTYPSAEDEIRVRGKLS